MSKIKAGINTTGTNWRKVFNEQTRLKLAEIADFNDRSLSESENAADRITGLEGAEVVFSTWGALPLNGELLKSLVSHVSAEVADHVSNLSI